MNLMVIDYGVKARNKLWLLKQDVIFDENCFLFDESIVQIQWSFEQGREDVQKIEDIINIENGGVQD